MGLKGLTDTLYMMGESLNYTLETGAINIIYVSPCGKGAWASCDLVLIGDASFCFSRR